MCRFDNARIMKHRLFEYNVRLVALFGILLLFSQIGCGKEEKEKEYDSQLAIYRVNGTVIDENGHPVAGIGIGCWNLYEGNDQYVFYYDTTDVTGNFVMEHMEGSPKDTTIAIALGDVDGEANGLFVDTVVVVNFLKSELQRGGEEGVYGVAEKEITVALRSANNN